MRIHQGLQDRSFPHVTTEPSSVTAAGSTKITGTGELKKDTRESSEIMVISTDKENDHRSNCEYRNLAIEHRSKDAKKKVAPPNNQTKHVQGKPPGCWRSPVQTSEKVPAGKVVVVHLRICPCHIEYGVDGHRDNHRAFQKVCHFFGSSFAVKIGQSRKKRRACCLKTHTVLKKRRPTKQNVARNRPRAV